MGSKVKTLLCRRESQPSVLADLGVRKGRAPRGQNAFIFMQFLGKIDQIIGLYPPPGLPLPLGNPRSTTARVWQPIFLRTFPKNCTRSRKFGSTVFHYKWSLQLLKGRANDLSIKLWHFWTSLRELESWNSLLVEDIVVPFCPTPRLHFDGRFLCHAREKYKATFRIMEYLFNLV